MLVYPVTQFEIDEITQFNAHSSSLIVICGGNHGEYIPADIMQNNAYQALWHLFEGKTPYDLKTWQETPFVVQTWRIRAILSTKGLETKVTQQIEKLPEPNRTIGLRAWEYSSHISMDSNIVEYLKVVLELTDEEVFEIFTQANNIVI
jgi:hypothetical protein